MSSPFRSPLHKMASTTPTELWNDSCSAAELKYAMEHGAVGATSNPTIVFGVLQQELADWRNRIQELFVTYPTWSDVELTWKLIDEMAVRGAELLRPVFDRTEGKKGYLSVQTNPELYMRSDSLVAQAVHFSKLAPNIQVKVPATSAGIEAIEAITALGISVNATVSFTVPQAIAVAEAVERGLKRREANRGSIAHLVPVCTIMVGRLDDWMKVCADKQGLVPTPGTLDWAGVACMKQAYQLYEKAGYRTRLLAAAYRNHLHWSEFIGGDMIVSIPAAWQRRFNASAVEVTSRIDRPVPAQTMTELFEQLEDFRKAYDPRGMKPNEFDGYGATVRTLRGFLRSYQDLVDFVRELRLPNPDK